MNKKCVLLVVLAGLLLVTGALNTWYAVGPKADALWMHYTGYRWFEPERAIAAEQASRLDDKADALEMARREVAFRNYPISGVTQYAFHRIENLPLAIAAGLDLQYLIGVVIFLLGVSRLKDVTPIALMLSAVALTALLPGPKPTDHLLLYSGFDAVANLVALLFAPGESFNPMSPWPKNITLLLAVSAFALRWQGKVRVGYALCAAAVLFHVTFGLVLLGLLAVIDILARSFPCLRNPREQTLGVVAICVSAGLVCLAIYIIEDPDMPWDLVSAFVQLATRLFILATLVIFLWLAVEAGRWLRVRLGEETQALSTVVVGLTAVMMTYAAAGLFWERQRHIVADYAALATPAPEHRDDIESVYFRVLAELRQAKP